MTSSRRAKSLAEIRRLQAIADTQPHYHRCPCGRGFWCEVGDAADCREQFCLLHDGQNKSHFLLDPAP